jgi:hypothetical protein
MVPCLLFALALSFSTAFAPQGPQGSKPLSAAATAAGGGKKPGKPKEPSWAARRVAGDSAAKQGREGRAKPWETKGDSLYLRNEAVTTDYLDFDGAKSILTSLEKERPVARKQEREPVKEVMYMWGSCSVGPPMKSRLVASGLEAPTVIQEAAFVPISKGESTLLVSETGPFL